MLTLIVELVKIFAKWFGYYLDHKKDDLYKPRLKEFNEAFLKWQKERNAKINDTTALSSDLHDTVDGVKRVLEDKTNIKDNK